MPPPTTFSSNTVPVQCELTFILCASLTFHSGSVIFLISWNILHLTIFNILCSSERILLFFLLAFFPSFLFTFSFLPSFVFTLEVPLSAFTSEVPLSFFFFSEVFRSSCICITLSTAGESSILYVLSSLASSWSTSKETLQNASPLPDTASEHGSETPSDTLQGASIFFSATSKIPRGSSLTCTGISATFAVMVVIFMDSILVQPNATRFWWLPIVLFSKALLSAEKVKQNQVELC